MSRLNYSNFLFENTINKITIFLIVFLSVLIAVLSINYLLYGIAALTIGILVFVYGERILIGLMIISLFILVSDLGSTLRLYVQLFNFLLLGILFLKRYGFNFSEYPGLPKSVTYFLLFYYSSMIISTIFSDHIFAGVEMITRQSIFFIIAYIFFSLIKDQEYIRVYLIALVITSFILAFSSIFQFAEGGFRILDFVLGVRLRVSSIISNTDTTTAFFILTLPLTLTFLFDRNFKDKKPLFLSVSFVILFGLFLIMSRSAILALIFSLLFILYYLYRKWFKKSILTIAILLTLFIVVGPLNDIMSIIFRIQEGLSQRDHLWNLAFNILRDNWFLGIGPGAYRYEEFNYMPVLLNSWIGNYMVSLNIATSGANASHSIYLSFFTDMGIPGIITIFYLMILCFVIARRTIKKSMAGKREVYLIVLSISAVLCSMFIRDIFDSIGILTYGYITNDLPFWLLFGILIYYYQKPEEYFLEKDKIIGASKNVYTLDDDHNASFPARQDKNKKL